VPKKQKMPLEGIVVLDLTNVLSGPYATLILSDLGANVIKVEKPLGDDSRKYGPFIKKRSGYFLSLNRGKKSIVLDLQNKKDKLLFEKLLKKSDVLIDNYKPGTLEKFGFGWKKISSNYPNLIHAKISGFGESGPLRNNPAYDVIVQAMGGIMSITGKRKNEFVRVGTSIGDIIAGMFAVIGILSQLIYRNKIKKGSKLDLSMLDCQVAILENAIARYSIEKRIPVPLGTDHPTISPFGSFRTKDSSIVIAIGNNKLFENFCKVIGDVKMSEMKIFADNKSRNINIIKLRNRIQATLKKKKTKYWTTVLSKNNIPNSTINNIEEVVNNNQIKSRKMIKDYKYNGIKDLKVSTSPLKFSFSNKTSNVEKAPDLDENRDEILKYFNLI